MTSITQTITDYNIGELIPEYEEYLRVKKKASPRNIRTHIKPVERVNAAHPTATIKTITELEIEDALWYQLKKDGELTAKSRSTYLTLFNTFLRWAGRRYKKELKAVTRVLRTDINDMIQDARAAEPEREHKFLTPGQVEAMMYEAGRRGWTRWRHPNVALLHIMVGTGGRVGDLWQFREGQPEPITDNKFGSIYRIKLPYSRKMGCIKPLYLPADQIKYWLPACKKLEQLRHTDNFDTFAGLLYKQIKRIGEWAGVDIAHPHIFRHTCGTWMAMSGYSMEEIRLWLGHKHISATERYVDYMAYENQIAANYKPFM